MRVLLTLIGGIVAIVVVWEIAALATMQYKEIRFVSALRRGASLADVQGVIDRQGIQAWVLRNPRDYTGRVGLTVAGTWRFGTPCDDTLGVNMFFEGGKLVYWGDTWRDWNCL